MGFLGFLGFLGLLDFLDFLDFLDYHGYVLGFGFLVFLDVLDFLEFASHEFQDLLGFLDFFAELGAAKSSADASPKAAEGHEDDHQSASEHMGEPAVVGQQRASWRPKGTPDTGKRRRKQRAHEDAGGSNPN